MSNFTPTELAERRKTLGASEIPVVAGYLPFKSPLQLWAEKRGLVAPFVGNEFTEWGNRLEPIIREKYAEVVGLKVELSATVICARYPWRSATPDGIVLDASGTAERGLEIKCRGVHRADDWGTPGTDEVPHDVAIQCQWGMAVLGLRRWDVATLIGGNQFGLYHLYADDQIANFLTDLGRAFWDHVENGTEPPIDGSAATMGYLRQKFPIHGDALRQATMEEAQILEQLLLTREHIKALEERESEYRNKLMAAIGENAGIESPVGKVTWKRPNGSSVNWKDVVEAVRPFVEVDEYIAKFTKPMSRRFLPSAPSKPKALKP